MNCNCFCKNFVYMSEHCRQLQWLYAKLKTLNKGFETTLLLPNFKRERWKEREMEKKKESIYSHVNEYIVDHVFFVVLFSFWPHGCSSLCLSDVYIPVHCIPGASLMHYIPITRLLIHACTKSPGPCQKHISIKAQTSPTVYLFKKMNRIRIQVNILSNLW